MKDYLGNEIHVGDKVYYCCTRYRGLHQEVSPVTKLTEKSVGIKATYSWRDTDWLKPENCVVVTSLVREKKE